MSVVGDWLQALELSLCFRLNTSCESVPHAGGRVQNLRCFHQPAGYLSGMSSGLLV